MMRVACGDSSTANVNVRKSQPISAMSVVYRATLVPPAHGDANCRLRHSA